LLERTFQIPLAGSAVQGYEIYHNIKNNKLTVTNRIPFSSKVYEYEEDGGTVKWILQKGKDTILGYICNKATAYFHGRHYTACYTMDIPSHLGPWKFSGLPGLILKINDDKNEYVFECSGISQQPEPIVRYDWKYEKISKKRWMEFEKHIYENAGRYIESTGERVSIYNNGKHEKIPLTWKKNYNPIEKVY
jgi:GLPGLI family protein